LEIRWRIRRLTEVQERKSKYPEGNKRNEYDKNYKYAMYSTVGNCTHTEFTLFYKSFFFK
jgi:hypothetical protein